MTNPRLDEGQVRRIVLVRAIEESDSQGKLLPRAEIEHLEQRAFQAARTDGRVESATALDRRAQLVLQAVAKRDPSVSGLQKLSLWRTWWVLGVPLAALVLGVATDRIPNPHRVDLLAIPLLLILLWNVLVYAFLLLAFLFRGGAQPSAPFAPILNALALAAHRTSQFGKLNRDVGRKFLAYLQEATASADDQRIRQVLHFAAAAWGAGIVLSLVLRGVNVEYRAGWESTWFDVGQVHRILTFLFTPVMALFHLAPFTLQDIASMRFDAPGGTEASHGRRWVFLYAGLLMLVVVVPRLVLGLVAWGRARHLSRRMTLDLGEPYFQDLIEKLCPAHVQLYVLTHRPEDSAALERVLRHGQPEGERELIASPYGDALSLVGFEPQVTPAQKPLWDRLRTPFAQREAPPPHGDAPFDVALHVVGDAADLPAAKWLYQQARPVLILAKAPPSREPELLERCRLHKAEHPASGIGVLPFGSFSGCWVQEPVLLGEIAQLLPRSKSKGFLRLIAAWTARNTARFRQALSELGTELVSAAREKERVAGDARTLWTLMSPAQRDVHKQATRKAEAVLADRLEQNAANTYIRLLELHGVGHQEGGHPLATRPKSALEGGYDVNSGLNASHAAMGGAATGATVGASVDLMTGGLTLGAAALLGALVGGSGAALAAAWKNRSAESGVTTVQLPDELLELITVERLLGYLQVIHLGTLEVADGMPRIPPYWRNYVLAAVQSRRGELASLWAAARVAPEPGGPTERLAQELEGILSTVLANLYPRQVEAAP